MNANGTHKRRLPVNFDVQDVELPSWSPDGKAIAFAGSPGNTDHVYVVNANGSGLRRLTNGGEDGEPVWSPDGKQIAFLHGVSPAAV